MYYLFENDPPQILVLDPRPVAVTLLLVATSHILPLHVVSRDVHALRCDAVHNDEIRLTRSSTLQTVFGGGGVVMVQG